MSIQPLIDLAREHEGLSTDDVLASLLPLSPWSAAAVLVGALLGAGPVLSGEARVARQDIEHGRTLLLRAQWPTLHPTAVLSTLAIAMSLLTVLIALPLATLLQRSALHAQLVKDARTDSKTGLMNAATWERGATAEVVRAVRTKSALAVALLDIDRFKVINDTYGHMTGDEVLKEIAHTLKTMLREYDLAGRFGGEEFALLLPQTRAVDAFRIAERIRSAISGLCIIAPGATGGERVHVTVSIGVAALDSGSKREYAELMAAADAAMYRAKSGGRDQVQMISTTRGLHAVSSLPRAVGDEDQRPSLFRRAAGS